MKKNHFVNSEFDFFSIFSILLLQRKWEKTFTAGAFGFSFLFFSSCGIASGHEMFHAEMDFQRLHTICISQRSGVHGLEPGTPSFFRKIRFQDSARKDVLGTDEFHGTVRLEFLNRHVGRVDTENDDRRLRRRKRIHVFHVDRIFAERVENRTHAAGTVRHLDGDHVGHADDDPVFREDVTRLLPVLRDDPENAEIRGVRKGERQNVDVVFRQDAADSVQRARLVFRKDGELVEFHSEESFPV